MSDKIMTVEMIQESCELAKSNNLFSGNLVSRLSGDLLILRTLCDSLTSEESTSKETIDKIREIL